MLIIKCGGTYHPNSKNCEEAAQNLTKKLEDIIEINKLKNKRKNTSSFFINTDGKQIICNVNPALYNKFIK